MNIQTFTADGTFLLNKAPGDNGPDGLQLQFTITGTNSGVLAVNTAPPGATASYTNVPYLDGALAAQSAGTAITASGLAYVSAAYASLDLYLVLNWTSGSVVVSVATASIGGGGSTGGNVPAGDITSGTFGANSGDAGDYTFPDDVVVTDDLTANDLISVATATVGTSLAVTTSTTTATLTVSGTATAAQLASIAGTVTATAGGGRAQRISTSLTAAVNADVLYGLDVAPTLVPGAFSAVTTAGIRIANNSTAVTGTKYGLLVGAQSGGTTANTAILAQGKVLSDSPTGGIGYTAGAGGAQTQLTNKQTTVVSDTITTAITMDAEALNLLTTTAFTFTNSTIAATDTVICTHQSAGTSGAYTINAFPGAGSAVISVRNNTAGNLSEAIVLRVTVIKSVSA